MKHSSRLFIRLLAAICVFFSLLTTSVQATYASDIDDWFIAVKNDRADKVEKMMAAGINVNAQEPERGDTALILAMRENSMQVLPLLLADRKINLNIQAKNGDTALMIACYAANEQAVKTLLEKGAKVNKNGWTPLHYAAASGNVNIIRMLLAKDAFVNAVSPNGTTPVMMAARNGHIYAVKLLHENGADLTIKNQRGYSAIDFASENNNKDIVQGLQYRIEKDEALAKAKSEMPKFPF